MIEIAPYFLVSDATREKFDRAKWEYERAQSLWLEAWQELWREAYAKAEMADHQFATPETDT